MAFNFATGEVTDTQAPGSPAPVTSAAPSKFDFATGLGGTQVQSTTDTQQPGEDYFAGTKQSFQNIKDDPLSLHHWANIDKDVIGAFTDSWQHLKDSWHQYTAASDSAANAQGLPHTGFAGKLGSTLKLAGAGAGVLFSPVTAFFKGAEDIPGIGTVAKGIDTVFAGAGEGGGAIGKKIIDALPIKDAKEKATLREGVGDIFALAAQIALGKATEAGYAKLKGKYGAVDAQTIVDKAKDMAKSHPDTPERLAQKVAESKARAENPETPIEATKAQATAEKVNDITQHPTAEDYIRSKATQDGFRPVEESEVLPNGSTTKMDFGTGKNMTDAPFGKEAEGKFRSEYEKAKTEGSKPSKVGQNIQEKAIEAGLTKGFEGTAEYDPITIKNQAARIAPFIEDTDRVMRILKGQENLPEGIRGGAFIKAVEDYGEKTRNAELLDVLSNSHFTSETSLHAQEQRLLRERNPNSVVAKKQEIEGTRKAKSEKVKGATKKREITKAKTEAKKAAKFTLKDADELLQSLIC